MLSILNFLLKRPILKVVHRLSRKFPQFDQSIPSQFILFNYMSKSDRKSAFRTSNAVQMLDKNTIEQLPIKANCLLEIRKHKKEFSKLVNILSNSPNLTNDNFKDKSSISENLKAELLASERPLELIKKYIDLLRDKDLSLKSIRIEPFNFHPLWYELSGLFSATIVSEKSTMRMIFSVNKEGELKLFVILPSHEYELLSGILVKAENLTEVQSFFEKYNVYWFNQNFTPEDRYKYLIRKCRQQNYSNATITYVADKKTQIIKWMEGKPKNK